jgi:hypothetical protein
LSDYSSYTPRQIVAAYRAAYRVYYRREADECYHSDGNWYIINGIPRLRMWVEDETTRLEELAAHRAKEDDTSNRRSILRIIRKLSGL